MDSWFLLIKAKSMFQYIAVFKRMVFKLYCILNYIGLCLKKFNPDGYNRLESAQPGNTRRLTFPYTAFKIVTFVHTPPLLFIIKCLAYTMLLLTLTPFRHTFPPRLLKS